MRVLIACEYSGVVRNAFAAAGHDATSCDLIPSESGGPHIIGDVLAVLNDGWDLMLAHPPCTFLATSGNRWRSPERVPHEQRAIAFFMALAQANIEHIAIENPVCIMSGKWRKRDQTIEPWQFGHGEQ